MRVMLSTMTGMPGVMAECSKNRHYEVVLLADEELRHTQSALVRRTKRTLVFVCAAIAMAGALVGWFAKEWTQSALRVPAWHPVVGTISSLSAKRLCVRPDDINTQPTCASTIALLPQPFRLALGTRVQGTYAVLPSDANAPAVFLWVGLVRTN